MISREVSASFQAVEDWLRSLGLLHYAQSFYDNGYEDIETCKLMKEEDLNVIDIKTDRDRQDILSAINKLKQNLYFELEPENSENLVERTKIETLILKTKLKECLEHEKIQLTEPPYYNPDGTVGDLYPLAIRYAAELTTFFDDVLEALEQLRKRQLPAQNYNIMAMESPTKVKRDQENRRSLRNSSNPAEYLNCETPCPNRSSSFSKYDTRVTKSTTDLTKDNINTTGGSPKSKSKKRGFLGVFKRGGTGRSAQSNLKGVADFKASELTLTQNEIVDIFQQVKNKELTQEDALDVIKRRGLSKSNSYDGGSPGAGHRHLCEQNSIRDILAKEAVAAVMAKPKIKSVKGSLRNRCASAQFYTKEDDIAQSSTSLISNDSKSSLEISGDHTGSTVDEDSISITSKNSPEFGKPGIFKKIRNSMRKKNKINEGESSTEEKDGSIANGGSPPEKHENKDTLASVKPGTVHSDNLFFTPIRSNSTEHPEPIPLQRSSSNQRNITITQASVVPPPPSTPPPPPPPRDDHSSGESQIEDIGFRDRKPSLKIKSYPMNQDEISKRRASEKNNNIAKSEKKESLHSVTTSSNSDIHPTSSSPNSNQIELVTELNKIIPKIPPRPAPRKSESSESLPIVPPRRSKLFRAESTDRQMDELVKEMNDIEADLENHLQHVNGDATIIVKTDIENKPEISKKPEVPLKSSLGWKKPVPPPRPNSNVHSGVGPEEILVGGSQHVITGKDTLKNSPSMSCNIAKRKVSEMVSHKQLISKKLCKEFISLATPPYTAKDGAWCVPYNLVMRYADELTYSVDDIIKSFEEIRVEGRKKVHEHVVAYTEKYLGVKKTMPMNASVDDYLIHVGLPMYIEDFREMDIISIHQIKELDEEDFKHIGIFDSKHIKWLLKQVESIPS